MARLNEIPQPAGESIDALKRRFVRQNREIAKANSTQSLRIRTLEGEVSRLLAENVSLREQAIKLHYEVENLTGRPEANRIETFRVRLEAKLKEVGDLVQELGDVQRDAQRKERRMRRSLEGARRRRSSPKRSPHQRNWRNALSLSDAAGEDDGRLPPILEDKYYPRRTLNGEEIRGVLTDPANVTDSPELGSPPIAHFEEPARGAKTSELQHENDILSSAKTSVNLESRKRRRESSLQETDKKGNPWPDMARTADEASAVAMPVSLKAGAKRKLQVRDGEDDDKGASSGLVVAEKGTGEFQFSRKRNDAASRPEIESNVPVNPSQSARSTNRRAPGDETSESGPRAMAKTDRQQKKDTDTSRDNIASMAVMTTSRKILGPKSTNMDPQSPTKVRRAMTMVKDDKDDSIPEDNNSSHDRGSDRKAVVADVKSGLRPRPAAPSSTRPKPADPRSDSSRPASTTITAATTAPLNQTTWLEQQPEPSKAIVPAVPEEQPETPGPSAFDLLSPTDAPSTGVPSSTLVGRGDTPPPPDLGAGVPGGLASSSLSSSFGRTSRRARGSVSYAEPNLRDKMRRPGKELVDAVASGSVIAAAPTGAVKRGDGSTAAANTCGGSESGSKLPSQAEHGEDGAAAAILLRGRWRDAAIDNTEGTGSLQSRREKANTASPLSRKTAAAAPVMPPEDTDARDEKETGDKGREPHHQQRGRNFTASSSTSSSAAITNSNSKPSNSDTVVNNVEEEKEKGSSSGTIAALLTSTSTSTTQQQQQRASSRRRHSSAVVAPAIAHAPATISTAPGTANTDSGTGATATAKMNTSNSAPHLSGSLSISRRHRAPLPSSSTAAPGTNGAATNEPKLPSSSGSGTGHAAPKPLRTARSSSSMHLSSNSSHGGIRTRQGSDKRTTGDAHRLQHEEKKEEEADKAEGGEMDGDGDGDEEEGEDQNVTTATGTTLSNTAASNRQRRGGGGGAGTARDGNNVVGNGNGSSSSSISASTRRRNSMMF